MSRGFDRYRHPGRLWMVSTLSAQLVRVLSPGIAEVESQLVAEIVGLKRTAEAEEVVDFARRELHGAPRPIYLFLNFMDTHKPYLPPDGLSWAKRLAILRDEVRVLLGLFDANLLESLHAESWSEYYDHGVESLDRELGRLFDDLVERGWWDDLLIVITADHGEAFLENPNAVQYFGHHGAYEAVVRIPLMVKKPGQRRGTILSHRVEQSDLRSSIFRYAGVEDLGGVGDRRLSSAAGERAIVTEWYPRPYRGGGAPFPLLEYPRVAIYRGGYKFVVEDGQRERLFDLRESPHEESDILADQPELGALLRAELAAAIGPDPGETGTTSPIDPALADELRALGYIR